MCSSGNYIQHPAITYNEKESEKEQIFSYICLTESPCCTCEAHTTLWIKLYLNCFFFNALKTMFNVSLMILPGRVPESTNSLTRQPTKIILTPALETQTFFKK